MNKIAMIFHHFPQKSNQFITKMIIIVVLRCITITTSFSVINCVFIVSLFNFLTSWGLSSTVACLEYVLSLKCGLFWPDWLVSLFLIIPRNPNQFFLWGLIQLYISQIQQPNFLPDTGHYCQSFPAALQFRNITTFYRKITPQCQTFHCNFLGKAKANTATSCWDSLLHQMNQTVTMSNLQTLTVVYSK